MKKRRSTTLFREEKKITFYCMYIAITNFFYWMTGRITYYHYYYHYVYTMDEKMMLNRNFNKNNNNAKDGEMEKLNLSITIMAMNTNLISKQNLMIIMQMSESWTFQPTRSGHLFPPFMFLYYTFTFHKHNYPNYYLEMLAVKCQFKMTWTCCCMYLLCRTIAAYSLARRITMLFRQVHIVCVHLTRKISNETWISRKR